MSYNKNDIIKEAKEMKKLAYCPYSKFQVGGISKNLFLLLFSPSLPCHSNR